MEWEVVTESLRLPVGRLGSGPDRVAESLLTSGERLVTSIPLTQLFRF